MPQLDLDALFVIAEAGPLLDKVAAEVPQALAQRLSKLQEDTGLEIDHEMTGAPLTGPGEGPESARLRAAYEPVTAERLQVLSECFKALAPGELKTGIAGLAAQLPQPQSQPAPALKASR